jgi:4-amino-4-deoxy-L-arabinose transferase-like glycosyltransferase
MVALAGWLAAWPGPVRIAALVLAALLVLLPGQAMLPPTDRDESRIAQVARQMIETANPFDPRFQHEAQQAKPFGVYWLQALAALPAGGAEAPIRAHRLPGLIGAALAVGLTAWAVAPLVGVQAGVLAALMLGATLLLNVEARIARADAPLLAAVVVAQGALARLWLGQAASRGTALLFWLATGFGVLLKGPIIALPILGSFAAMALAERRLPRGLRPLTGLAVLAVVLAPWIGAILLTAEPGTTGGRDLLWRIARSFGSEDATRAPPGTHLSLFFVGFWPFAALAPVAAFWLWRQRKTALVPFLVGWIVLPWLLLEIVPSKLPDDMLIVWPAVAAVIAACLRDAAAWAEAPDRWLRGLLVAAFAVPGMLLVLGGAVAVPLVEGRFEPVAAALAGVAAVALAVAAVFLWRWQPSRFAAAAGAGSIVAFGGLLHVTLPALDTAFVAPRLAAAVAEWRCGATGPVAVTTYRAPSVVLALGTDTILTEGAGAGVVLRDGRAALAFVGDEQMAGFAEVAGARATALTRVEGFDYTRLRPVALTLYAYDRKPGAACGG